jgi:hypothetical protein
MNIKLFTPYEKQRQFLDRFADTDDLFGVVVAPRGSGKTLLGINSMLYWLLSKPNQKGGWISPVYSQAKNVFDTITQAAKEVIEASNRMETTITFVNGSSIKFLSGDSPDSIRGFRFSYLVIDEVAFIKERTIDQVILPTLNPNGKKCLMISTPKGKNHFYNWYLKEESVAMKFPLSECPYVKDELIAAAKTSLPPDLFKQEFEAEFVDSSNDVFVGIDKVATVGVFSGERMEEAFIGIDTGLSDDMSVLTVISPIGRVLWIEALNNENISTIANRFINIMNNFKIVGGYIETNGIGRGMYDLVGPKFRKVKEFNTTQDNKTEMVRKLISDIETMTIELPTMDLCPELHSEFGSYTYKMSQNGKLSFGHSNGAHDDYIDSLMMANYSRVKFMDRKPITIRTIKPSWS